MTVGVGARLEFTSNRSSGALLFLGSNGRREHLDCVKLIKEYMTRSLAKWYSYAKDERGMDVREEDIVFVSGFTKTAVCATASFQHETEEQGASFRGNCTLPGIASGSAELSVDMGNANDMPIATHVSPARLAALWGALPQEDQDHPQQCIFLEYYRMKRRMVLLKKIVAAAGPHELPPPDPPSGASPTPSFEELIVSEQESLAEEYGLDSSQVRENNAPVPRTCSSD